MDSGDTAWMLAATALVLMMTPALGLFYAGLVRSKNTLNTFMMCVGAIADATAVTWALVGYSLAFDGTGDLVGGLNYAFLHDVTFEPRDGTTIPHLLFMAFQATFCIITVALVSGAVVERMRFGAFLVFAALWSVLVYAVMAHWAFGGGWLHRGAARSTSPAACRSRWAPASRRWRPRSSSGRGRTTGARRSCRTTRSTRFSAPACCGSAGSGSTAEAASRPGIPVCSRSRTRSCCPACTLVVWFVLDALRGRRVTAIGAATAIIVGCVGITPAGGFVSPPWAMVLGAVAALPAYAVIVLRPRTRVDETLDVLAAHGIAGFTGILFIGFFAQESWNGVSDGLLYGNAGQLGGRRSRRSRPLHAFGATFVLLKVIMLVMPLRATERGGLGDGRRPTRRGGLRDGRGRDPGRRPERVSRARWRSPTRASRASRPACVV